MQKEVMIAGNPILKSKSKPVKIQDISSDNIQKLIHDLFDTMEKHQGVGIAAPQIGVGLRVFVYGFDSNPRYPGEAPVSKAVMINPEITEKSNDMQLGFEGCLSLGTLRGEVPRHQSLTIQAYNEKGEQFTKDVAGFEARIIQHELDHLDGLLTIERMKDFHKFGFTEELKKHNICS